MRAVLADEGGHMGFKGEHKTEPHKGPDSVAEKIADLVHQLAHQKPNACRIVSIGIGSPGPLSRARGMIFQTPNLPGFNNYPLADRVRALTGLPVFLDNDANCATHGEAMFGVSQGVKDFVLLTIGTGIGGGLVSGGKMIYGKSDGAAELGHLTLYPGGEKCLCGRMGCFEQYCSATAIERRGSIALNKDIRVPELFMEYDRGTPAAVKCLNEIGEDFAIAIGSLINIFDPEQVVLAGGAFSTGGGPLVDLIKEKLVGQAFESSLKGCSIIASSLKGNGGVLGAAAMAFKGFRASGLGLHQLKA